MGTCNILKSGSGGLDTDELTAVTADILSGKIAGVTGTDEPVTGTMPNRGAISQNLNAGGSYSIPAGYHNGAGKVTANSLSSQTSANATAAQILSGQTAWVNGAKVTGSMTNRGAVNQVLTINGSYSIPAGYHNGSGKVTQSVPVQGGSTTTPGTANKTVVAANRYVNGNVVVAGSGNLTTGNIKKGVNIFGVVGTFQGYVDSPLYLWNNGSWSNIQTTGLTANRGVWYLDSVGNTKTLRLYEGAVTRLNETVDLSNYSYIKVYALSAKGGSSTSIYLGISQHTDVSIVTNLTSSVTMKAPGQWSTLILNISSFSGKWYIYLAIGGGDSFHIQQLYLAVN